MDFNDEPFEVEFTDECIQEMIDMVEETTCKNANKKHFEFMLL